MAHKFTLITPSYNQEQYLEQTIASVLVQEDVNIEYIVIDGGSSDSSVGIIKKYENKLSYWESKPDTGQSNAINKGLAKCTGEIFNWLCSDDYLESNSLNTVSELFQDDSIKIVCGKVKIIDENDKQNFSISDSILFDDSFEKTFARSSMTQPGVFWKMDLIKKFGGINERLHYLMDLELWLKYMLWFGLTGIKTTEHILANYRIHPQSKTYKQMDNTKIKPDSAFNIEKNTMFYFLAKKYGLNQNIQDVIKKLMNNIDEDYIMENIPDKPALNIKKAINYYLYDFLRRHFYFGDLKLAAEIAKNIEPLSLDKEDCKGLKYLKRQLFIKKISGK